MKIYTKIAIGLALGVIVGPILGPKALYIEPIGRAFIKLIVMLVVPLVVASLTLGTASLGDIKKLGRVGLKTVAYYLIATALAVSFGLVLANTLQPGVGLDPGVKAKLLADYKGISEAQLAQAMERPGLWDIFLSLIPSNPIKAMAESDMLPIITFSILAGIAMTLIKPQRRRRLMGLLESINDTMIVLVDMVMKIAPYGVFALMAGVAGRFGYEVLLTLLKYVLVTILALFLFLMVVYSLSVRLMGGIKPLEFFKIIRPVQLVAFSTCSSNATLPINLKVTQEELKVSKDIASFVLPLGATVNMHGTAIYHGVSALFIAQVYGIDLSFSSQIMVVLTATLASIGCAGVPGIGMITLTIVLTAIGIPVEGIALVMGVERILDMCRTVLNVTGDSTCAVFVAWSEGSLNWKAAGARASSRKK
ncbi:MAG: dicarboxylate/amino acid:cation symporter [Candidatus Aminicenantes bacterium]|nr:dicarboxylate/amino acid:cation symporter [Candidatus Aminicenantes bacterium]